VGLLNSLHAILHILQFLQSMLLVASATEHNEHEGFLDGLLHNPWFALFWGIVGIMTLWIGIKDFINHRKCQE